jgi:GDP-4-dehydro-6-deoxy-D-mannose reductase
MRVLITGSNGFSSKSLIKLLSKESKKYEIFITDINQSDSNNYHACDLTDTNAVKRVIKYIKPEMVYNLAGSMSNDYETDYKINALAPKNILDAVLEAELNCRVLLVGSSAEYGAVKLEDNPINEQHALEPVSTYGLTKLFQTNIMNFYISMHNMDIVMARTFNLLGRGMSTNLFVGRLYQQIDDYKEGKIKNIVLGNLSNRRDYLDVDKAISCYRTIMEKGVKGEIYNVGSGEDISILELLQKILSSNDLNMGIVEQKIFDKPNKFDIKTIVADTTKLKNLG